MDKITKPQSELLTRFYREYAQWLKDGAPLSVTFNRYHGLCYNYVEWLRFESTAPKGSIDEMTNQFMDAGLNMLYPFETSDLYRIASRAGTCHLNPLRIKWVNDHSL